MLISLLSYTLLNHGSVEHHCHVHSYWYCWDHRQFHRHSCHCCSSKIMVMPRLNNQDLKIIQFGRFTSTQMQGYNLAFRGQYIRKYLLQWNVKHLRISCCIWYCTGLASCIYPLQIEPTLFLKLTSATIGASSASMLQTVDMGYTGAMEVDYVAGGLKLKQWQNIRLSYFHLIRIQSHCSAQGSFPWAAVDVSHFFNKTIMSCNLLSNYISNVKHNTETSTAAPLSADRCLPSSPCD